jgi:hypothetical protein
MQRDRAHGRVDWIAVPRGGNAGNVPGIVRSYEPNARRIVSRQIDVSPGMDLDEDHNRDQASRHQRDPNPRFHLERPYSTKLSDLH